MYACVRVCLGEGGVGEYVSVCVGQVRVMGFEYASL